MEDNSSANSILRERRRQKLSSMENGMKFKLKH